MTVESSPSAFRLDSAPVNYYESLRVVRFAHQALEWNDVADHRAILFEYRDFGECVEQFDRDSVPYGETREFLLVVLGYHVEHFET